MRRVSAEGLAVWRPVAIAALAAAIAAPAAAQLAGVTNRAEFMCDCLCVLAETVYCPFTPASTSAPKEYTAWLEKNGKVGDKPAEFFSECPRLQACETIYYSHPAVHPLSSNWMKTYGSVPMKGWVRIDQASGGYYPDFKPQPIWSWSGQISMTAWPTLVPVKP